jgi:hypothetical protein
MKHNLQEVLDRVQDLKPEDLVPFYLALKGTQVKDLDFADVFDLFMIAKVGKIAVDVLPEDDVHHIYAFSRYLEKIFNERVKPGLN